MIPKHFLESVRYESSLRTALQFAPPFSDSFSILLNVTRATSRAERGGGPTTRDWPLVLPLGLSPNPGRPEFFRMSLLFRHVKIDGQFDFITHHSGWEFGRDSECCAADRRCS